MKNDLIFNFIYMSNVPRIADGSGVSPRAKVLYT